MGVHRSSGTCRIGSNPQDKQLTHHPHPSRGCDSPFASSYFESGRAMSSKVKPGALDSCGALVSFLVQARLLCCGYSLQHPAQHTSLARPLSQQPFCVSPARSMLDTNIWLKSQGIVTSLIFFSSLCHSLQPSSFQSIEICNVNLLISALRMED